jgi:hypothetical protein
MPEGSGGTMFLSTSDNLSALELATSAPRSKNTTPHSKNNLI